MSILRTYNVQNPDSAATNIQLSADGGISVAGIVTATGGFSGNITGNINATGVSTIATLNVTQSNPTNLNVSGVTTTATLRATSIVGVTTAGITTAYIGAVNDGPLAGVRNFIINGSMQVWQRGTSVTAAGYTVDRFMAYSTNTGTANYGVTVARQQDSPIGYSGYCAEISLSNTGGLIDKVTFGQRIEAINFYGMNSGETMTLSFYLKRMQSADSNLTIYVRSAGNGVDSYTNASVNQNSNDTAVASQDLGSFNSLSTSWTRYTFTFTVTNALITNGGVVFIQNGNSDLNVTNTNALYRTTGWQLEPGTIATPFERRSYGQEFALCQRYYQKNSIRYGTIGYFRTSSIFIVVFELPVSMRSVNSVTLSNFNYWAFFDGSSPTMSGIFEAGGGGSSVNLLLTASSGGSAGGQAFWYSGGDTYSVDGEL